VVTRHSQHTASQQRLCVGHSSLRYASIVPYQQFNLSPTNTTGDINLRKTKVQPALELKTIGCEWA